MAEVKGIEYKTPVLRDETLMYLTGALTTLLGNRKRATFDLPRLNTGSEIMELPQRVEVVWSKKSVDITYTTIKVPGLSSETKHRTVTLGRRAEQILPIGGEPVPLDDWTALAVAKDLDSQIPDQLQ